MLLALKELRRGKAQFAAIMSALTLLVFLVLVLGALADGLFFGATGALRQSPATHYVFAEESKGSFVRSQMDESVVGEIAAVPGVRTAGPIGVLLTGGQGPQGGLDVAVFGVDPQTTGIVTSLVDGRLPDAGESGVAAADTRFADDGVRIGSTITVGGVPAEVVGFVDGASFQLQPTLWTSVDTWRAMRDGARPELQGQTTAINAVAVMANDATDPGLAARIAEAVPGTSVLSSDEAGLAIPGVKQQNQTLSAIINITYAVAALVVALFFALLVLDKRALFAVLKAIGTPNRSLALGVVFQAVGASVVAVVIGGVLARAFALVIPPTVPALFRNETLLTTAVAVVVFSVLGALLSLRRIARIDPATAIGGAQ